MARTKTKSPKSAKEPGRLKQMYQVFQMTRKYDPTAVWWMALGFAVPVLVGIVLAIILSLDSVFGLVLWIISGVLGGLLVFLIILGRKAEKAAYSQIAGQPGAVGAVLKSSLPRGWVGSEMPVAISPKTQDAVYRAVGRGGVVLIGEGPKSRTQKMVDDERRKVSRILPNVPINVLQVGPDVNSIPLHKLSRRVRKFKRALNKAEIYAVSNRVSSLHKGPNLPIPKGVDPMKARAQRRA
ncbi:MAG: DUF4191 domain-containing protein [Terrimesophilobacter sp.]